MEVNSQVERAQVVNSVYSIISSKKERKERGKRRKWMKAITNTCVF